ncbi:MAG TPA: MmgE/PrpD family protein, partial [Myxococcales bacterium]|nr:MmgE/PrpD family protein [Myxococcales bacterium]
MAVAEELAERIQGLHEIPQDVRETCERLLIDVAGLCLVARRRDYVKAALAGFGETGPATAMGHRRPVGAACAAFVNGTAAHGEDYDDTFEGGPVHAGAVVVPAVLAAAELEGASGSSVLRGMAVGVEILCRLSVVVPKAVHASGFHPTAVLGAPAAAAAVASTLRLEMNELVDALGISGSMASGIIEYLAEGTWTKRLHPGWAAQSGVRAALLGRAGFRGPRTVFEGTHGLFNGFARTREGNYGALLDG